MRNNIYGVIISAPSGSTATASVDRCRLERNDVGIYVSSHARVAVTDTVASNVRGTGTGFETNTAGGGGAELTCDRCTASNLSWGFISTPGTGAVMRVSRSVATNNDVGFYAAGGLIRSLRGTNLVDGNGTNINGTITTISGAGEP
jgi:hypothetical protein